jgi:hypothetical protein
MKVKASMLVATADVGFNAQGDHHGKRDEKMYCRSRR